MHRNMTPRTRALSIFSAAALGAAAATAWAGSATTQAGSKHQKTFTTQGTYSWIVPKGVTQATFNVYGASGGNVTTTEPGPILVILATGGAGGEAKVTVRVKAGQKFEIVVGGVGSNLHIGQQNQAVGGFNGGGTGGLVTYSGQPDGGGAAGGGASDVRIGGVGNGCGATTRCTLNDRVAVGGGGGGAGYSVSLSAKGGDGGAGGGRVGLAGGPNGEGATGGTQVAGGVTFDASGGCGDGCEAPFGRGLDGLYGGGGGGWYGGGGGGGEEFDGSSEYGGGGGSGYASSLVLAASFPGGTHRGDGKVIVTWTT